MRSRRAIPTYSPTSPVLPAARRESPPLGGDTNQTRPYTAFMTFVAAMGMPPIALASRKEELSRAVLASFR